MSDPAGPSGVEGSARRLDEALVSLVSRLVIKAPRAAFACLDARARAMFAGDARAIEADGKGSKLENAKARTQRDLTRLPPRLACSSKIPGIQYGLHGSQQGASPTEMKQAKSKVEKGREVERSSSDGVAVLPRLRLVLLRRRKNLGELVIPSSRTHDLVLQVAARPKAHQQASPLENETERTRSSQPGRPPSPSPPAAPSLASPPLPSTASRVPATSPPTCPPQPRPSSSPRRACPPHSRAASGMR